MSDSIDLPLRRLLRDAKSLTIKERLEDLLYDARLLEPALRRIAVDASEPHHVRTMAQNVVEAWDDDDCPRPVIHYDEID